MKLNLNISDRLTLLSVLPEKGDFLTMAISRGIKEKIILDSKEIEKIGLKIIPSKNGISSYTWDSKKARDLEILISDAEADLLKKRAQEMDKEKLIDNSNFDIIKKIRDL